MTPRERVLAAFRFSEPDRVPVNYLADEAVSHKLRRVLRASSQEAVLCYLGVDIRRLPSYEELLKSSPVDPTIFPDLDELLPDGVPETAPLGNSDHPPLANAVSLSDLRAHNWPDPDWFSYSSVAHACAFWEPYAIAGGQMDLVNGAAFLIGFESLFISLALNDGLAAYVLDRLTEFYVEFNDRLFAAGGGRIDIAWYGDDYATQQGLVISLETWDTFIAPRLQRNVDVAKKHGAVVMLHSCGAVRPLIPRLIDMGIDVLDTVQPTAAGMDPVELKKEFHGKMAFHGAVDIGGALLNGTPEDVRTEVQDRIRALARGGGYVLAPSHLIYPDSPVENVLELYRAATVLGRYS